MTINFRRNALQLSVAALFSSAFMANAADVPQVKVTVTDKQCEPMTITVNAGKTQFIIQNHSQKALEWEILKGVMVVEERRFRGFFITLAQPVEVNNEVINHVLIACAAADARHKLKIFSYLASILCQHPAEIIAGLTGYEAFMELLHKG